MNTAKFARVSIQTHVFLYSICEYIIFQTNTHILSIFIVILISLHCLCHGCRVYTPIGVMGVSINYGPISENQNDCSRFYDVN